VIAAGQRPRRGALDLRPVLGAGSKSRRPDHRNRRAKGGVGRIPVAHNVAWAIARDLAAGSVVADLDLAFGTPVLIIIKTLRKHRRRGILARSRRYGVIDACCRNAPTTSACWRRRRRWSVYDFGVEAFDSIFDTLRTTMPCIVLDVPHNGRGGPSGALVGADDILIVAAPTSPTLRNTKNIFDLLRHRGQTTGRVVLSQSGRCAEAAGNQRPANSPRPSKADRSRYSVRPANVRARRPTTAR